MGMAQKKALEEPVFNRDAPLPVFKPISNPYVMELGESFVQNNGFFKPQHWKLSYGGDKMNELGSHSASGTLTSEQIRMINADLETEFRKLAKDNYDAENYAANKEFKDMICKYASDANLKKESDEMEFQLLFKNLLNRKPLEVEFVWFMDPGAKDISVVWRWGSGYPEDLGSTRS